MMTFYKDTDIWGWSWKYWRPWGLELPADFPFDILFLSLRAGFSFQPHTPPSLSLLYVLPTSGATLYVLGNSFSVSKEWKGINRQEWTQKSYLLVLHLYSQEFGPHFHSWISQEGLSPHISTSQLLPSKPEKLLHSHIPLKNKVREKQ